MHINTIKKFCTITINAEDNFIAINTEEIYNILNNNTNNRVCYDRIENLLFIANGTITSYNIIINNNNNF